MRSFLSYCQSGEKHSDVTLNKDINNNNRNDVFCIEMDFPREAHPSTRVSLFNEILPSPAVFGATEENIYKRTERKDILTDKEILKVQNRAGSTKRMNSA